MLQRHSICVKCFLELLQLGNIPTRVYGTRNTSQLEAFVKASEKAGAAPKGHTMTLIKDKTA